MPTDVRPRSYGLKRHGAKAARMHKMALLLLVTMEVLLNRIEPFHRFVGEAMMKDPLFRHPLKHNTLPFWAVGVLAVLGPMVTVTGIHMMKRSVYDLYHAIIGLLFSVLITGVLTDAIKDVVGRPSPNFFWRCFPDGIPNYNNVTTEVICHGDAAVVKEGYKSFPSGHSSWSFAGLGFLSWYLAGKIRALDREGQATKLFIIAFPLLLAALVAVSRVSDNWHHWQDVCTGGILGLVVATLCYLHFIPSPFGEQATPIIVDADCEDAGNDELAHWTIKENSLCSNAYYCHILNTDMGHQRRSTTTVNHDQSRHNLYQEYVEVEMTTNSQSLDSMEAGNIAR